MANTPYYVKAENDAQIANVMRQYNFGASEYQGYLLKSITPTLDGWYWATEIGTYTNAGGLVTVANKINMIEKDGATYKLYAIDVPQLIGGITDWTAKIYAIDEQVTHLGKLWKSNTATVAGDVPGTSGKWDNILASTNEEISFNTTATKQVKLYGDWKTGDVLYFKVRNLAVTTTGSFNAQLWDWDNSISYTAQTVNNTVKITLTANTKTLGLHLNLTGTVTSAYCVMGLYDSLVASAFESVNNTVTNTNNIAANLIDLSLSRLQNGLRVSQTTTQRVIKVGTLKANTYLRFEVSNIAIVTTGSFNFQVYNNTNSIVLLNTTVKGVFEITLANDCEIWVVSNITGTITTAEFDIKMSSSLKAIEDRNLNAVIKFDDRKLYGYDYNTTGYVTYDNLALFSYQNMNASKGGVLNNILLNVGVVGTFTFAIGTLDQRNWAIISKEFDVVVTATGRQTINVSDKRLTIGLNDYLFVYTKKNGSETINWKSYPSANSNPNFILGNPSGAILPFTGTFGGGFVFTWDVIPFDTLFASKQDLEATTAEVENVASIANTAYNSIAKITDSVGNQFKMWVVNGAITLQSLNFSKVLVIGNSLLLGLAGTRGLACTVPANDFASQLLLGVQSRFPTASLTKIAGANWERNITTDTNSFDTLFAAATDVYDLIIIRLGENVNVVSSLQGGVEAMIDYLKLNNPLSTIVVTSTVLDYGNSAKNTALSTAATNKSVNYVAINGSTSDLQIGTSRIFTNASNVPFPSDYTILTHSNDLGFLFIANSILGSIGYTQLSRSFALNVTANVTADYPTLGVQGGIVTIKTYGGSAPNISVNGGAIAVTHYQLSTFTYDNRLINGVADTATYSSTFIMPASAVTVTID